MKSLMDKQTGEATLHWSRNSYFMVTISALALAYSQKPLNDAYQLALYHGFISALGIGFSLIWLAIQYRSSSYILYYKTTVSQMAAEMKLPDPYSKTEVHGIEMRILAYFLPIAFLIFWVALLYIAAISA
jgi:hypothetical protein